jgi:hypothetical protein
LVEQHAHLVDGDMQRHLEHVAAGQLGGSGFARHPLPDFDDDAVV